MLVILFAFPPDKIDEVLGDAEMKEALRTKSMISILARTRREDIAKITKGCRNDSPPSMVDGLRIVRAMSTMGAEVHESATLITNTGSPEEKDVIELCTWIFKQAGKVFPVSNSYFDIATGMVAFSNAFMILTVENISQKAVLEGVPEDHTIAIASQCIQGIISLVLAGTTLERLKSSVSAPGSITGQAISNLEASQLSEIIEKKASTVMARAK